MFNKLKKGIFIKIKNNKLAVFLPFSKFNFTNEWGNRIRAVPSGVKPEKGRTQELTDIIEFFRHINDLTNKANNKNYRFDPNNITAQTSSWYANNCLLRFEHPMNEGDTNVSSMKNMLEELCGNR